MAGINGFVEVSGYSITDMQNSYDDGYADGYGDCKDDLEEITLTQNGTYEAEQLDKVGFDKVVVNVPGASTLVEKTITQNGIYNPAGDNADGYSLVTVDVEGGGGATWVDFTQEAQATITPTTEVQSDASVVKLEYLYDTDRYMFYVRVYIDYGTDSGLAYNVSFTAPSTQGIEGLCGFDTAHSKLFVVYSDAQSSVSVVDGIVSFVAAYAGRGQHCYAMILTKEQIVYTDKEFVLIYGRNPRFISKTGYTPAIFCFAKITSSGSTYTMAIIIQSGMDFSVYTDWSQYSVLGSVLSMLIGDKLLFYQILHKAAEFISDYEPKAYIDGLETGILSGLNLVNATTTSIPYTENKSFWDYCLSKLGGTTVHADIATINGIGATIGNRIFVSHTTGDKTAMQGRWYQRSENSNMLFSWLTFTDSYYASYAIISKVNEKPAGTPSEQWGDLVYAGTLQTGGGVTLYVWRMNGCWDGGNVEFYLDGSQTAILTPFTRDHPYISSNNSTKVCTTAISGYGNATELALFNLAIELFTQL